MKKNHSSALINFPLSLLVKDEAVENSRHASLAVSKRHERSVSLSKLSSLGGKMDFGHKDVMKNDDGYQTTRFITREFELHAMSLPPLYLGMISDEAEITTNKYIFFQYENNTYMLKH